MKRAKMTLDQMWKRPVNAAEEFDRTMALRMARVGAEAIAVTSVEDWHGMVLAGSDEHNAAWRSYVRLSDAEAFLRATDGSEWVLSRALFNHDFHEGGPGDNRFLQRLHALMVEHRMLVADDGKHYGPGLEMMLLRRDTLDYRRAFCTTCNAWRDLQADAEEIDRLGAPWE
jgi:hypothetical protein